MLAIHGRCKQKTLRSAPSRGRAPTAAPDPHANGTRLIRLPVSYLEWFQRQGFPEGKLGALLSTAYEIRTNGLEYLMEPLEKGID